MKKIFTIVLLVVLVAVLAVPAFAQDTGNTTNPSGQDCIGVELGWFARNTDQGVGDDITIIVNAVGGRGLAKSIHDFRDANCN